MAYTRVNWEDGIKVSDGYVTIDGTNYTVVESIYEGNTPINKDNLNIMDKGISENSKSIEKLKGTILWTNPNPTNDFSTGNITLSSNDYDVLEFYYNNDLTAPTMDVIKIIKGFGAHISYMSNGSLRWWTRRISYVNDTTFSVPDCVLINSDGATVDNGKCIPLYIVGYKNDLFEKGD